MPRHICLVLLFALLSFSLSAWAGPEELINVSVTQASLDQVVRMIAKAGDVNVLFPPELAQRTVIQLRLENVTAAKALRTVLSPHGYRADFENNVYQIRAGQGETQDAPPAAPQPATQGRVDRVLPLRYASALEIAAMFGVVTVTPTPAVPAGDRDEFISHQLGTAVGSASHTAGQWQYSLETGPASSPATSGLSEGALKKMLPGGVAIEALPAANALRVSGPGEEVAKFEEVLELLDKPRKRVVLQLEVLQGTAAVLDSLRVANWSYETAQGDGPAVTRFTTMALADLRQRLDRAGDALHLAVTTSVSNNELLQMRVGEVMPQWTTGAGDAAAVRVDGQFLTLRLVPRVNADESVTMLVEGSMVVGQTQPDAPTRFARQVTRIVCRTQVRASTGEMMALALGSACDASDQPLPKETLLGRPILLITPRVTALPAAARLRSGGQH